MEHWFRCGFVGMLMLSLSNCYQPPYNHFQPHKQAVPATLTGSAAGAAVGAAAGSTVAGLAIGAAAGASYGLYQDSQSAVVKKLSDESIQYVQYGDTNTLIVPTDKYYLINSATLNDLAFLGLNNIAKLLSISPHSQVYVAGFTDDIGSKKHRHKLSRARAEAMLAFLWANGISAQSIQGEGYGKQFPIGDNALTHGSAYNRRVEIQWFNNPQPAKHIDFAGWKK